MSAFSPENISKAIARIPSTATKDLRALLLRARKQQLYELVASIESELSLRGPINLDASGAEKHNEWAKQAADLNLADAIQVAFTQAPINEYERALVLEIARHPGISHEDLTVLRGKRDVSLILGHMVYERLGFFRKFVGATTRMSDLLFKRDDSSGRMTYHLTKEADQAWRVLGLF